jgi:hypothetical protein
MFLIWYLIGILFIFIKKYWKFMQRVSLGFIKNLFKFINPRYQNLYSEYRIDFKPRYGHGNPAHPKLHEVVNRGRNTYLVYLQKILSLSSQLHSLEKSNNHPQFACWDNGFLPGLDILALYTMISVFKPRIYLEIGSGNSTKIAYMAKNENSSTTRIISVDPNPRTEVLGIADDIIRLPLEKVDLNILNELKENDIIFLDNSHRILPNSDSMVFFLEMLPDLKKGIIVQLHDIYLPYDYPQFMCERFYSEQYGLAMWLLANPGKFEILLPNYFISEDKELSSLIASFWEHPNLRDVERHGGSFWMRIKEES